MADMALFHPTGQEAKKTTRIAMQMMGDWLERPVRGAMDLAVLPNEGIKADRIRFLEELGYTQRDLSWVISPRTLKRRLQQQEPLHLDEADRLIRAMKVLALAVATFGSREKAQRWMEKPKQQFQGRSPKEMIHTESGAQLVHDALNRIDSGYFA